MNEGEKLLKIALYDVQGKKTEYKDDNEYFTPYLYYRVHSTIYHR